MNDHLKEPVELRELHPYEYEHPFDAKALDALQSTPGLDMLVRQFNKHAVERLITVQYTGSNLRITEANHPKIHRLLDAVCDFINLPARPDLYLQWGYEINGFTVGVDNPIVVLNSGSIDLLSEEELLFLIGHEVGHIKSRHTLYHQMADFLPFVTAILGQATLGLGRLVSAPLELALLMWARMSEFTADRAGLLACQNPEVAIKVMMKWAGMPIKHYDQTETDTFVDQARQFESLDYETLNKAVKFLMIMNSTHPWTVMRSAELLKWVETGEYRQVVERKSLDRLHVKSDGKFRFCRKCGYKLQATEKFCPGCGAALCSATPN